MADNAKDIVLGGARIYVGGTAPTAPAGMTPLDVDSSGVPSTGGTDLGLTGEGAVFHYEQDIKEIYSQQGMAPVKVVPMNETAYIEFSMLEVNWAKLKDFLNGSTLTTDTTPTPDEERITGGGSTAIATKVVTLVARQPIDSSTTLFHAICLYKAYNSAEFEIKYDRENETMVKVRLNGLADTTRTVGDQVYQIYRQIPA